MLKLALCFSGDPRTYSKCFESIKTNLLDEYDCDVFISTYETNDDIKNDIIQLYNPKKYNFNNKDNVNSIVSEYSEKMDSVRFNSVDVFDKKDCINFVYTNKIEDYFFNYDKYENKFEYKKVIPNALGQFFGICDVAKLCKEYMVQQDKNYDYILRIRMDNIFRSKFVFDELKENEVLINDIQYYSDSIKLHDHFLMAKPVTFFKFAYLYDDMPKIIEFVNKNRCWIPGSGYQETYWLIQTFIHDITFRKSKFFCIKLD